MYPPMREIERAVLEALVALGGQARPKDVYPRVTEQFPQLTESDLTSRIGSGANRWVNKICWARLHLRLAGCISAPKRGVWAITEKGRRWLEKGTLPETRPAEPVKDKDRRPGEQADRFRQLYGAYESAFRARIVEKLHSLAPEQFEQFAEKLLSAYGFKNIEVTAKTKDGGIDGHGRLLVGLAEMEVAFQCKRWKGNVPRQEIDKFRGAIQGRFEQGVFFTTADFTKGAREASIQKGAVPIVLLNGDKIADLMIEKNLGVRTKPLLAYQESLDELFGERER